MQESALLSSGDRKGWNNADEGNAAGNYPVGIRVAAPFLFFACFVGTHAEALNDMHIGLKIRGSLSRGQSQLAISEKTAIIVSMSLALLSETRLLRSGAERSSGSRGGGDCDQDVETHSTARRGIVFASLWAVSQLCRIVGASWIDDNSSTLVGAFMFLDKYTGPLGAAALENALLSLLSRERTRQVTASEPGRGIRTKDHVSLPATFLFSLRATSEKLERPLWELLLMWAHVRGIEISRVGFPIVLVLTMFMFTFVFASMQRMLRQNISSQNRRKAD